MYLPSPECFTRLDLAKYLISRKLTKQVVEVGTHRAVFASQFLEVWPGSIDGIDHWDIPPSYEYQASLLPDRGNTREDDLKVALKARDRFLPRLNLIRTFSQEVVAGYRNSSLDMVYLDGDHAYEAVLADLIAWFPKIRDGGIIAGHDVVCCGEVNGGWSGGIQRAIEDFLKTDTPKGRDTPVYLVIEPEGQPWSYYIAKE